MGPYKMYVRRAEIDFRICIDLNGIFEGFFVIFLGDLVFFLFPLLSTRKLVCLSIEKGGKVIKKNDNIPPPPRRLTVAGRRQRTR